MNDMRLKLVLELDERGAIRGIRDAAGNLVRLGREGARAGTEIASGMSRARAGIQSISEQLARMRTEILALLGAHGIAAMVRDLARISDAYREATARLAVASRTAASAARAYEALAAIARETRADWGATVELYARLARATKEAGISQQELLTVVRAVNEAVIVSGASAQEAEAAMIQLAQGLASGALRGDELRSVLEQMPRLAEMIARGMGVSLGELRTLGEQGMLTTEAVIAAIRREAASVHAEFQRMPPTIGQAITQIKNAFTLWLGEQDKALGASQALAHALLGIADHMDMAARSAMALAGALGAVKAQAALAARGLGALGSVAAGVGAFFTGWQIGRALAREFAAVRDFGITLGALLHKLLISLRYWGREMAAEFRLVVTAPLDALRERLAAVAASIAEGARFVGLDAAAARMDALARALHADSEAARRYREEITRINRERKEELALIDRGAVAMMREAMQRRQAAATPAPQTQGASGAASVPLPTPGVDRAALQRQLDALVQAIADAAERERMAYKKRLAVLKQALEQGLITRRRYQELEARLAAAHEEKLAAIRKRMLAPALEAVRTGAERAIAEEQAAHARRLAMLREALDAGLITRRRYQEMEAELVAAHERRLSEIQQQEMQRRQQQLADFGNLALSIQSQFAQLFADASRVNLDQLTMQLEQFNATALVLWQQGFEGRLAVMKGALAMAASLMASHDRRMFELGKAAAIANAIISTAQGVAKALEWGWPLGPIFAGIIGAAGAAQIATIASTRFGQTSGRVGVPAAGVGGGAPSVPVNPRTGLPAASAPPSQAAQQPPQPFAVHITIRSDTGYVDPQAVRLLTEEMQASLSELSARGAPRAVRAA